MFGRHKMSKESKKCKNCSSKTNLNTEAGSDMNMSKPKRTKNCSSCLKK